MAAGWGVQRVSPAVVRRLPLPAKRAVLYRQAHGRRPARPPQTFTEKVNWRVVHDRRPLIGQLGDKLAMRQFATATLPGLSVPRVLWAGVDVAALAEVDLPERWVLKPNHGTMRVHLGTGRPDVDQLHRVTAGWLDEPLYRDRGEWVYRRARRLLLVEEFLGSAEEVPADHKLFVFDGRLRLIQVDTGRFGAHRRRLYTPDWTPVDVDEAVAPGPVTPPPASLARMTEVAEALGAPFDFVRVDLYDVGGRVWFGELTPYPGGGLDRFDPALDVLLGSMWRLPPRSAVRAGQQLRR
ncbi:ATP-grasp fold amidoligase family protein [Modestobacter sp. VKM Ac-2983]|uniref:ATP-grasp fold amidoligase family protein n=1 Tax=Modestobacter sp. VKM Ac-2983 TaxID=3004137 RepID=UPI0022AB621A|nr:ATP-grasp fold amidoligase family protein [Modestobacter sp. VKM Ac-2983]MCZ2803728.1 ATP-grasp fold amidoligase family protein [Modestobacter sp. VKM Ac-2983]